VLCRSLRLVCNTVPRRVQALLDPLPRLAALLARHALGATVQLRHGGRSRAPPRVGAGGPAAPRQMRLRDGELYGEHQRPAHEAEAEQNGAEPAVVVVARVRRGCGRGAYRAAAAEVPRHAESAVGPVRAAEIRDPCGRHVCGSAPYDAAALRLRGPGATTNCPATADVKKATAASASTALSEDASCWVTHAPLFSVSERR
jgi:hypothetical protein